MNPKVMYFICGLGVGTLSCGVAYKLYKILHPNEDFFEAHFSDKSSPIMRNYTSDNTNGLQHSIGHLERMVQFINSAKHNISLCIYSCSSHELSEAIIRAHKRGVRVRILGCFSMNQGFHLFGPKGKNHLQQSLRIIVQKHNLISMIPIMFFNHVFISRTFSCHQSRYILISPVNF